MAQLLRFQAFHAHVHDPIEISAARPMFLFLFAGPGEKAAEQQKAVAMC